MPTEILLSETRRQDVGAAGDAKVLMQVKWGPHLGPNGIGLNK